MADERKRLEHLITLACDAGAGEGEARNAAFAAVKLIKKLGLELVTKSELAQLRARVDVAERNARSGFSGYSSPPSYSRPYKRDTSNAQRVPLINKYANKHCFDCGRRVAIGERCEWVIEVGVRCWDCVDERPRPGFDRR